MTVRFSAIVCVLLAVSVFPVRGGEVEPLPQIDRPVLPAPPIFSGDGAVVVYSSAGRAAYRGPILVFVNRTRELFQSGLNMKLGSQSCPLEVRIGDKSDGDKSVLTARLRNAQGGVREVIELPDPEAADLDRFRRAVAVAFLRAWMVDAGGTDETMRNLPGWLIDGMMRYLQGSYRQADLDRAYRLWSNACLPPAEELYAFESYAAETEPAVASVLAGWFLERRGHAFKILLKETALGREWSVDGIAQLLASGFTGTFDRMLDLRMIDLGGRVIQPGVTTAGIVGRFRSELLLFPADYGMMFSATNAYCSFYEAIALSEKEEIRTAAGFKALKLRTAAAGRDGMLLAVSERYEQFLHALAAGREPERLEKMLAAAESGRAELERRVRDGTVLRRNPEGREE